MPPCSQTCTPQTVSAPLSQVQRHHLRAGALHPALPPRQPAAVRQRGGGPVLPAVRRAQEAAELRGLLPQGGAPGQGRARGEGADEARQRGTAGEAQGHAAAAGQGPGG